MGTLDLEEIKPWDGLGDTGKDVRLKLSRNFKSISDAIIELQNRIQQSNDLSLVIKSDKSITEIVKKTESEYASLVQAGELSESTLYIVIQN
jgi:hypothetical protein